MKKGRIIGVFAAAAAATALRVSGLRKSLASARDAEQPVPISPLLLAVPIVIVLLVGGLVLYLMFSGPRMKDEPKFTPYRALLPPAPEGTVAVAFAAPQVVASLRNPLPDTEQTRRSGQVYYGYYCAFCHGKHGHGEGPVGRSYVPTPTDLTAASVQNLSDGALYQAMQTGVGHAPVLDYVMEPNVPWYIVAYVRQLAAQEREPDNLSTVHDNE